MIIYSNSDLAGQNIARHLRRLLPLREDQHGEYPYPAWSDGDILMAETPTRLVELNINTCGANWILCLSRHRSESGKRCLTVHTPGNLTDSAELGGSPSQVGISNPALQTMLLAELKGQRDATGIEEEVTVEATHHGPTSLPCPVTFIEIGSDEGAWVDPILGECVAKAIANTLSRPPLSLPKAMGVGGGHYPEKFTKMMLSGVFSIGHIIPKYSMMAGMPTEMFSHCIQRTEGGVATVLVDWKGTPSAYKERLKALTSSSGIELIRV